MDLQKDPTAYILPCFLTLKRSSSKCIFHILGCSVFGFPSTYVIFSYKTIIMISENILKIDHYCPSILPCWLLTHILDI